MTQEHIALHLLFILQHLHTVSQRCNGSIQLGTHEVGRGHLGTGQAYHHGSAHLGLGQMLTGQVVHGNDTAAICLALQGCTEQSAVKLVLIHFCTQHLGCVGNQAHPGIDVGSAVIAVCHGHGLAAGGAAYVDLGIVTLQRTLQNLQGEGGSTGRNGTGTGMDSAGGNHTGTCVTLGRTHGNTGLQGAADIQQLCAFCGQLACACACGIDLGENLFQLPAEAIGSYQCVKLSNPLCVIVADGIVIGEHAGSFVDTGGKLAGKQGVDIAAEGGQTGNLVDVAFLIEDRLVQVGNAPALGDVEPEQFGQFAGCGSGDGITPGAERCQLVAFLVEDQVAVHHTGNADGSHFLKRLAELSLSVSFQLRETGLDTLDSICQFIGPHAVFQLVLPAVGAGSDDLMVLIDQNALDTGRAQLNAQNTNGKIHKILLIPGKTS